MSVHESDDVATGFPLKALVEELRSRCEAVARLQGGFTYFIEEIGIFRDYVKQRGHILASPPAALNRPPDDEGNEHQVWFLSDSNSFLKATWPGFYGLLVIHRPHEELKASPIDYLERWLLHNELFGDDVRFIGALEDEGKFRMLIRQPAIAGVPATGEQIERFFTGNGWLRFVVDGETAFFDPKRQVVISDTHRGNLILMDDGLLAPIDLRVQPVTGALLDIVRKLCESAPDL